MPPTTSEQDIVESLFPTTMKRAINVPLPRVDTTNDRGEMSVVEVNGDVVHVASASVAREPTTLLAGVLRRAGVRAELACSIDIADEHISLHGGRSASAVSSVALQRRAHWLDRVRGAVRVLLDEIDDSNSDNNDNVDNDNDDDVKRSAPWWSVRRLLSSLLYASGLRVPPIHRLVPRSLAPRPHAMVRALAWHPRVPLLAIATVDAVLLFNAHTRLFEQFSLAHEFQRNVLDLAWRPGADSALAVACGDGVALWHVEFDTRSGIVSTAWVRFLRAAGHEPVSSLAWAPDGVLLASASPNDSSVVLWDVDLGKGTPLGAAAPFQGVTMVRWAPDSTMLMAATPTSFGVYRIADRWQLERWTKCGGGVLAAAWLPDSSALLLACAAERGDRRAPPTLTALRFARQGGSVLMSLPLPPLQATLRDGRHWRVFGGAISDMSLNDTAERLAITFAPDRDRSGGGGAVSENGASLVALFAVTTRPTIAVLPIGAARLFGSCERTNAVRVAFSPHNNEIARELLLDGSGGVSGGESGSTATLLAVSGEDSRVALMPCVMHGRKVVRNVAEHSSAR
jgi:hypothetical protein